MPQNPDNLSSSVNVDTDDAQAQAQAMIDAKAEQQRIADQMEMKARARMDSAFTPSSQWQEIPEGVPVPPGGDFRMDTTTGKNFGRWPEVTSSAAPPPDAGYMGGFAGYDTPLPEHPAVAARGDMFGGNTPFYGSRYTGPANIPYSQAAPPPQDRWSASRPILGRVDSGFARGATFEDTSSPWYGPSEATQSAAPPSFGLRIKGYAAKGLAAVSDRTEGSVLSLAAGRGVEILGGVPAEDEEATASAAPRSGHGHGKEGLFGGNNAWIVGGALYSIGEEAAHYNEATNSGRYLTPEQQTTAAAGFFSGAGTVLGFGIGAALGNPVIGAMAGGALGSVAQGIVGADDEKNQALRETTERLNSALGGTAESLEKLRNAAEATGAPIQQLGQGLSVLQGLSPGVGIAAVTGAGKMALAEGDRYGEDTAGVAKFLGSDPALYGAKALFATKGGDLSAGDYRGIAQLALSRGDMEGYNAAQDSASAARYAADPQYNRLARSAASNADSWSNQFNHAATTFLSHFGIHMEDEDPITTDQKALDARKAQIDQTQAATDAQDLALSLKLGQARYSLGESDMESHIAGSGFDLLKLKGGSADALLRLLPGLRAANATGSAADQTFIDQAQESIKGLDPKDPAQAALIQGYQSDILKARQDQAQRPVTDAQYARSVFEDRLGEHDSQYSLAITRSRIEGKSASAILEQTLKQSRYLQGVEADPHNPLSPAEKAQIEEGRLTSVYQARQSVYAENLSRIDLRTDKAQAGVTSAAITGGPEDVYSAQMSVVDALNARVKELTHEFHSAGQAASDYIREQRQLTQAQKDAAQAAFDADQNQWAGRENVVSISAATASVGADRDIRTGGNAAFPSSILSFDTSAMGLAQSKLDSDTKNYPGNAELLAKDKLAIAQSRETFLTNTESAHRFSPDGQSQIDMMTAEGEFSRAKIAPYSDPGGDPFTRGNQLLSVITKQQAALDANYKKALDADSHIADPRLREQATMADRLDYTQSAEGLKNQRAELEHQKLWEEFNALPFMIAGGPGRGVGAALIAPAALSAMFSPNANVGSWGGMSGWWSKATGAGPYGHATNGDTAPGAGASGGNNEANRLNAAMLAELTRIRQAFERGNRTMGPAAPPTSSGSAGRQLEQNLNPYTRR